MHALKIALLVGCAVGSAAAQLLWEFKEDCGLQKRPGKDNPDDRAYEPAGRRCTRQGYCCVTKGGTDFEQLMHTGKADG